jgi:large subunit ribosomal protein L11
MIKKKIGIQKGSGKPNSEKVGKLTKQQVEEIAKDKMEDMNANTVEAAMKIVAGTARSMGVDVDM